MALRDLAARDGNAVIPVVGIGASAGGLDAISRFLVSMPADSGAAFIVILHLDPGRHSMVAPLLARQTSMPVVEIVDGMAIEANRVHVIVPDRAVIFESGRLRLVAPIEPRGHRRLVDNFFSSLAVDRRERAIGIVLSGMGANGTLGLKEIKVQGGMTLAQDPDTAGFESMPRSAIAAGTVDYIVPVEEMPAAILRFIRHDYVAGRDDAAAIQRLDEPTKLEPLLVFLFKAGHDFRGYKRGTVARRIHRRMGLSNQKSLSDYTALLTRDSAELHALAKDLMITVTSFFRDPEAWQTLDEQVIAPLVAERESGGELRFWVPACATGEEAYSLVMLAVERAEASHKRFELKVFATDSQEHNLIAARDGLYPEAATANLSAARLKRFFDRVDGSYQIKKEFRERVVFAPQNLLRDPPFSRLDLITCRNLLIYLDLEAQKRVLALFHFALRDGGYLFLGSAETVGTLDELFETRSKKWRIYRGLGQTPHNLVNFPVLRHVSRSAAAVPQPAADEASETRIVDRVRRALIERYAPALVLVDAKGRVVYFHGPVSDFLELPSGEPTRDVLSMARNGLRAKLRGAMRQVLDKGETVVFDARVREGADLISVTVAPLDETRPSVSLLLVSFAHTVKTTSAATPPRAVPEDETPANREAEAELKAMRAELQGTIEQVEIANEELKSANEEVTSMNEELQSTNEELETSKEELQSFNEELHTTNHQLQQKIHELEGMTDDLNNLLAGSRIATVFLDGERRIKWFSPATQELFDLVVSDVGRPLGHFALKFDDPTLMRDTETVLANLQGVDAEVRSHSGRWFLRKMLPYRTRDNRIAGLVITFADISDFKRAADAVEEERVYCHAIVETIGQPLLVLDTDLRVRSANGAFYALFATTPQRTEGRLLLELSHRQWDIPELRTLLDTGSAVDGKIDTVTLDHEFETLGRRAIVVSARRLARGGDRPELILLAIDDVTARHDAEQHRDLLVGELRHRVKNTLATVQALIWQTARTCDSLPAFTKAFESRLRALSNVHDILVEEGWRSAEINGLMQHTLAPYRIGPVPRITIEGPAVAVAPSVGVALAMIVQELVTNATKYGSLSTPTGTVAVSWRFERGIGETEVRLRWAEMGGPSVVPPAKPGFGIHFIERASEHELHGKSTMEFAPKGLICEILFPSQPPQRAANHSKPDAS